MTTTDDLDYPRMYRGVSIDVENGLWVLRAYVTVIDWDGAESLVTHRIGAVLNAPLHEHVTSIIDSRWVGILAHVRALGLHSVDGLPWEIHSVEDPLLRAETLQAYLSSQC